MHYNHLGRSGLKVSAVGLGTMNFGMTTGEEHAHQIMDVAVDAGINLFDTADVYGGPMSPDLPKGFGLSEEMIGRWLQKDAARRDKIVLATKLYQPMGYGPNDRYLSAYHIRRAAEASLTRLQADHIDLYQMHHIDRRTPWEEVWQAMEQLVREGKVSYIGSSNFAGWHVATAQAEATKRNFMGLVSEESGYSLASREIEMELIPSLRHHGIGLIPYSPLGGGLLSGVLENATKGRRANVTMQKRIDVHRAQIEAYEQLCKDLGEAPADVALAWVMKQDVVSATLIGSRTPDQLSSSLHAIDVDLSEDTMKRLDEIWAGPGGEAPEAYAW